MATESTYTLEEVQRTARSWFGRLNFTGDLLITWNGAATLNAYELTDRGWAVRAVRTSYGDDHGADMDDEQADEAMLDFMADLNSGRVEPTVPFLVDR